MKLRIWHIPQVPGKPFYVPVETPEEGAKLIEVLSIYDQFQYQNKIKPDFCNACGLQYYDDREKDWLDWTDENGFELDDYMENQREEKNIKETFAKTLIVLNKIKF